MRCWHLTIFFHLVPILASARRRLAPSSGPRRTPLIIQGEYSPISLPLWPRRPFFEPDYGSTVRHLTPLLPLMLYVMWWARNPTLSGLNQPA